MSWDKIGFHSDLRTIAQSFWMVAVKTGFVSAVSAATTTSRQRRQHQPPRSFPSDAGRECRTISLRASSLTVQVDRSAGERTRKRVHIFLSHRYYACDSVFRLNNEWCNVHSSINAFSILKERVGTTIITDMGSGMPAFAVVGSSWGHCMASFLAAMFPRWCQERLLWRMRIQSCVTRKWDVAIEEKINRHCIRQK